MNEKEAKELANRLNSIYSNEYQQYHHAIKELIKDVRRQSTPLHTSSMKLVLSNEHGETEVKLESILCKSLKKIVMKAIELNNDIDAKLKDRYVRNLQEIDCRAEASSLYNCIKLLDSYCAFLFYVKEKRAADAKIKNRKIKIAKRIVSKVLNSRELHVTYQKNSRSFKGYKPFDELLSQAGISEHPELKIYLHHDIKEKGETRSLRAYAGSLKKKNGSFYLNGSILLQGGISTVERWLRACYAHLAGTPVYLRKDPDFPVLENISELTQKEAEMLAEIVLDHINNGLPSERKSLKLIRETLGDDAVNQLKNEKRLTVKSKNGRTYIINEDGEVYESETGRSCCVVVEAELPRYDQILAKYLAIRDRPETIKTLSEMAYDPDLHVYYFNMFRKIIHKYKQKIEEIGFSTGDFDLSYDERLSIWNISMRGVEVTIQGGRGLISAPDDENDLTGELWDAIGDKKLSAEFLRSMEYMKSAFEHYLSYLERYLAWTPEYVIIRKERVCDDETEERIRRIKEIMARRREGVIPMNLGG
jgi:hypothetical protein